MSIQEQLKSLQDQMQSFDASELTLDNIGMWPLPIKAICWLVVFIAIVVGGYFGVIQDLQGKRASVVATEETLKKEFQDKASQAANLSAYKQQMKDMEETFGALISQLPTDTEVPGLLEDITNKGVSSGLSFKNIKLKSELTRDYYIELPIEVVATGNYHDIGAFVSGVASLPRIVTLTNFSLKPLGAGKGNQTLELKITASTYRYRDLAAEPAKKTKKKKKKKKGKK